jgi:uncharacterized membrane protein
MALSKSSRALQFERLLFFSDAVFAIAITLLVIDIRLPHGVASEAALQQAMADLVPNYISFFISFFVIGRFWQAHRRTFGYLQDFDESLAGLNLLFLLLIAFLPYPTAVLGSFGSTATAVIFYGGWLVLAGLIQLAIVRHIVRRPALWSAPLTTPIIARLLAAWLPVAIGLSGIVTALVAPRWGIITLIVSPFLFGLLRRWIEHRFDRAEAVRTETPS